MALKEGDRVKSKKEMTSYLPFTGTIEKVFVGFVKVVFDKPQGPDNIHHFALTNPNNLELIPEEVLTQYEMPKDAPTVIPETQPLIVKPLEIHVVEVEVKHDNLLQNQVEEKEDEQP